MFGIRLPTFCCAFCLIFIGTCNCLGLLPIVLPHFGDVTRNITNRITRFQGVQTIVGAGGNAIALVGDLAARIPLHLARSFGTGIRIPFLNNKLNRVGLTRQYLDEFRIGSYYEDTKLEIRELISKYGYPLEEHRVTTDDGYVLSMFRIPGEGPPVYLQHGLLGSADDFVVNGPDNALAYLLASDGYDVWLGNCRGNKHSRRHRILKTVDKKFWDFSWHEIGLHDVPSMIDYVLEKTGQKQLVYIGHSQGTTAFFVMASERPEYNDKIKAMIALSAVAYMEKTKSPIIRLVSPGTDIIHGVMKIFGIYEFLPDNGVMRFIKFWLCGRLGLIAEMICENAVFLMCGFSIGQLNATSLPVQLTHIPSGAATKQLVHYGQGVISNDFRQFDHGRRENMVRYGQEIPPSYVVERISSPVHVFQSEDDWFAHPDDVKKLVTRMPNVKTLYTVESVPFNHLDYVFGRDCKPIIYKKIVAILVDAYKQPEMKVHKVEDPEIECHQVKVKKSKHHKHGHHKHHHHDEDYY